MVDSVDEGGAAQPASTWEKTAVLHSLLQVPTSSAHICCFGSSFVVQHRDKQNGSHPLMKNNSSFHKSELQFLVLLVTWPEVVKPANTNENESRSCRPKNRLPKSSFVVLHSLRLLPPAVLHSLSCYRRTTKNDSHTTTCAEHATCHHEL